MLINGLCSKFIGWFVVTGHYDISTLIFSIVLLYVSGILVFPVGWDRPQVKEVCGTSSSVYNIGNCTVGWAFILIIIGTVIGIIATCISWTPVLKRKKDERRTSYTL